MSLEEGGGHLVVHLTLDRAPDDGRLVLPGGENEDLAGVENRGDAHRDRLARNILLAEEVRGRIHPRHEVQGDEPGAAVETRARLVEPDVAGSAYAQKLQVDSAGDLDRPLVAATLVLDPVTRHVAAGDMHIFRENVELGEEVLPHEPMVGMETPRIHRVVLIEIEGDDVGEAEAFLPMHSDQLAIGADRRGPCSQAEHGPAAGGEVIANDLGDPARRKAADVVVIVDDDGTEALWRAHRDCSQGKGTCPTGTTAGIRRWSRSRSAGGAAGDRWWAADRSAAPPIVPRVRPAASGDRAAKG